MGVRRGLALAGVTAAMVLGVTVAPAVAAPIERVHFDDEFSEVTTDFCGDLTVRQDFAASGIFLANPHGRDGLIYILEKVKIASTFTNLANGKTWTEAGDILSKDLSVADNGDGTLTILVLATGSFKVYGPTGEFLFNDPGQVRFELLVDHGGTPTDPSDDELLDLRQVKGSTGRSDLEGRDFCEDIHTVIG